MYVLGIDPGIDGALASLETGSGAVSVFDMPTVSLVINRKKRRRVDMHSLWAHLSAIAAGAPALVVLEAVNGYGGDRGQSASAAFVFGHVAGALEALVIAAAMPIHLVPPAVWKKALGVPAAKDGARLAASRLFPASAHQWSRVKDDGRAEAALLAWYGATHVLGAAR